MQFTEHSLDLSIMELFENEGYTHQTGQDIHREKTDVMLSELLSAFLLHRYVSDGITESEITTIITQLKNISGSDYDANKRMLDLICNGFTFRREDKSQKDLFIQLIDFKETEQNFFEIVNQVEIQGREQLRIPDGIVYVNGLPLVVLEFKSAIKENTTIEDAYEQLTILYRSDIPELFKYNAFVVISDGVNNKIGSLFSPYEYFYAWRKIESTDKEVDGISSLITIVKGLFRKDRLVKVVKNFVTEFNYLFNEIYKCANIENPSDENYSSIYNFGNNARKFLEIYLFYKFPYDTDEREKQLKFFDSSELPVFLNERINNEYSHLNEDIERAALPTEVPEIKRDAQLILNRLKELDLEQYNALLNSIGVTVESTSN